MDPELELLQVQAELYHIKGQLPLVSYQLRGPAPALASQMLLDLADQLDEAGIRLSDLSQDMPEGHSASELWQQMHAFCRQIDQEYEVVQLQVARWWLALGSPEPRPECLLSFFPATGEDPDLA